MPFEQLSTPGTTGVLTLYSQTAAHTPAPCVASRPPACMVCTPHCVLRSRPRRAAPRPRALQFLQVTCEAADFLRLTSRSEPLNELHPGYHHLPAHGLRLIHFGLAACSCNPPCSPHSATASCTRPFHFGCGATRQHLRAPRRSFGAARRGAWCCRWSVRSVPVTIRLGSGHDAPRSRCGFLGSWRVRLASAGSAVPSVLCALRRRPPPLQSLRSRRRLARQPACAALRSGSGLAYAPRLARSCRARSCTSGLPFFPASPLLPATGFRPTCPVRVVRPYSSLSNQLRSGSTGVHCSTPTQRLRGAHSGSVRCLPPSCLRDSLAGLVRPRRRALQFLQVTCGSRLSSPLLHHDLYLLTSFTF